MTVGTPPNEAMGKLGEKIAVSAVALGILLVRHFWPELLDPTDLVVLAVGLLPWLASLINSAELPGGVKIEFQDIAGAAKKVTAGRKFAAVFVVIWKSLKKDALSAQSL